VNLGTKSSFTEMSRSSSREEKVVKKKASQCETPPWNFKPPSSISESRNPFKSSIRASSPSSLAVPSSSGTDKFSTPTGSSPSKAVSSDADSPVKRRPSVYARSTASSFGMSQASFHTAAEPEGSEGLRDSSSPTPFVDAPETKSRRSSLGMETVMGSPQNSNQGEAFDGRRSVASDRTEQVRSRFGDESLELRPSTSASFATLDLPNHFPQPPNRALKAQRSDDGTILSRAGLDSEDDRSAQKMDPIESSPSARFYQKSSSQHHEASLTSRASPARIPLLQPQDPRASLKATLEGYPPSEEEKEV